jgi:hypothetical protein
MAFFNSTYKSLPSDHHITLLLNDTEQNILCGLLLEKNIQQISKKVHLSTRDITHTLKKLTHRFDCENLQDLLAYVVTQDYLQKHMNEILWGKELEKNRFHKNW